MRVKHLIERLRECDPEAEVVAQEFSGELVAVRGQISETWVRDGEIAGPFTGRWMPGTKVLDGDSDLGEASRGWRPGEAPRRPAILIE